VILFLVVAGFAVTYYSGRAQGRHEGYYQALLDARKRAGAIVDP
jgi:hypothetical protein